MKKIFIIALIASVISTNVFAAQADSSLCTTGYKVYYLNGILTDANGRFNSTKRVESMLGNTYNGEPVEVFESNNPSLWYADFIEVFAQKMAEDPTLSWQLFFRWASGEFINQILQQALEDFLGTHGSHDMAQSIASLSNPQAYTDPTVVGHAGTYSSDLLAGKRVMVVAHSQGNLYANAIYGRLQSMNTNDYDLNAFGIAAVASPANFVATGDNHVTSDTDHVIDIVRYLAPATLSDNDNSVPFMTSADRFGHGFLQIYTSSHFGIKSHTLNVMGSTMARISNVIPNFAGGPITATLTWSSPGDIDLHTYEPDSHVYYAARQGLVGYLDRDDTTGTGPEHYYTSCQNFQTGTYSFGVNYYSGSGTKQATVKLSVLGVDYPARTVTVTTPRYSSGDNSPVMLWRVSIGEDGHGGYTADIQ
jgi:uncharacterized protein YfaP (DUF2135 family)